MSSSPSPPVGALAGSRGSAWPLAPWRAGAGIRGRHALWIALLICVLVAQGVAVTESIFWAVPLVCVLFLVIAPDIPIVPVLGVTLFVRVLTDASFASRTIRHGGSLNLSGIVALLFMLIAAGYLIRYRRGLWPAILTGLWLIAFTAVAARTDGASTETLREGVREGAIVALAFIVYNARGALNIGNVTRMIQAFSAIPALVALYQFATHTGLRIGGEIRANGTISHPDGAAMLFAIATTVSVWRYFDLGRRRSDMLLAPIFAGATIATFSLGGLASLLVMLMVYGTLRTGSLRLKLGAYAVGSLIVVAFLATPLGAERLERESTTSISSAQHRGESETSLSWRFYKWGELLPEWERSPLIGQGLGTTITQEGTHEDASAGIVPHNEYIRYLVETGVIGLGTLLAALALLIRSLVRRRRLRNDLNVVTFGIAVLVGCMFNAVGDNTLLYSTTAYPLAMILAAVLAGTAPGTPSLAVRSWRERRF